MLIGVNGTDAILATHHGNLSKPWLAGACIGGDREGSKRRLDSSTFEEAGRQQIGGGSEREQNAQRQQRGLKAAAKADELMQGLQRPTRR